ncbi:MAG: DUF4097 family beta strand repeat-containing protein [Bacteroidota bacterium]
MLRNYFFSFLLLILPIFSLSAQDEYRIDAAGKTIHFKEIDRLVIQGTNDSELLLNQAGNHSRNERARGLRVITGSGPQDNTGIGLSITTEGNTIIVQQVGRNGGKLEVSVPNSAIVKVTQSTHDGVGMEVSDFGGELDVSMMYHRVRLRNISGPAAINTVYGGIEAVFDQTPQADLHLHSTYSSVDLALPANTAADLRLSTSYGDMYTDFDILISANTNSDNSNGSLEGKINGGGSLISLAATYSDIYLRKQ